MAIDKQLIERIIIDHLKHVVEAPRPQFAGRHISSQESTVLGEVRKQLLSNKMVSQGQSTDWVPVVEQWTQETLWDLV